MFEVALYRPEIPPNTGNIIRLCANTGAGLHLIGPLGFSMEHTDLKRGALDHFERVAVRRHDTLDEWLAGLSCAPYLVAVEGGTPYHEIRYRAGDAFLFGNEAWGVPDEVADRFPPERRLRIPQLDRARCLNLANAVAVVLYEALRQQGFAGLNK